GVRGFGCKAVAPGVGAEPVAELGAAIARVAAEADAAEQGVGCFASRDRERDAATLRPPRDARRDPACRERDGVGAGHREEVARDAAIAGAVRDRFGVVEAQLAEREAIGDEQRWARANVEHGGGP